MDIQQLLKLQYNLIYSPSSGVEQPLRKGVVRAAMLIRVQTLMANYSGVRSVVVECLFNTIHRGEVAWVPEQGSIARQCIRRCRGLGRMPTSNKF